MQIILLEQLKKIGNVGDVVTVKNGYARNFLIPNNKALRATKDNIAYFESKKVDIEKENGKKKADAEKIAKKIEGTLVTLVRQAGEDGRLYGSVNAVDISKALVEGSKEKIDRKQIVLNNPIKYIGIHEIEVSIYGDVSAKIYPNVARSDGEAKDAEKRHAKGEAVMEGPSAEGAEDIKEEEQDAKVEKPKKKAKKEEEPKEEAKEESKSDSKKEVKAKAPAKKETKEESKKPATKKSETKKKAAKKTTAKKETAKKPAAKKTAKKS